MRLIVWCKSRGHHVEPDPGEQAARLRCSACGGREVDFVVTGPGNRGPEQA